MRRVQFALAVICLVACGLAADDVVTTARVFNLRYHPVAEAATVIQPLLSEQGSLTLQPYHSRLTVQDRPEIVAQVAAVLKALDRPPERYRILVELFEASDRSDAGTHVQLDERLRQIFHHSWFRRIGATTLEGEVGGQAGAHLGSGYRIRFTTRAGDIRHLPPSAQPPAVVMASPGYGTFRVHLDQLTLIRTTLGYGGLENQLQLLRANVALAPSQRAVFRVGASENSERPLVLILKAKPVGE